MKNKYVITKIKNTVTGFHFEEGRLADINCYEAGSLIGNVYIGRVDNIVKNINAAFVNIDKDTSCYLSLDDYRGEKPLRIGDELPVQIVTDRIKTKQMAVSADISLANDYVVVSTDGIIGASNKLPTAKKKELKDAMHGMVAEFSVRRMRRDISYGAIVRTKAQEISLSKLCEYTFLLLGRLDQLMSKIDYNKCYSKVYQAEPSYLEDIRTYSSHDTEIVTDLDDIYACCIEDGIRDVVLYEDDMISMTDCYRLNHYLEKALSKRAYMNSGAYLVIEPTEALTVIDVNSGKAIKGSNAEEIILKINLEAAAEVARQLRIRNITGIIVVDFISMKKEAGNRRLLEELSKLVYYDSVKVNVVGMTGLGLVELTRQKSRKSLDSIFGSM